MGGIFNSIETTQPNLDGKTTDQKIDTIMNYLFMLREQLDYALCNLEIGNFNEHSGIVFTDPVTGQLKDAEGNVATVEVLASQIQAQVTDANGNYTVLNLRADGLHIGDATGTTTIAGSSIQAASLALTDNLSFNSVSSTASSALSKAEAIANGSYSGGTFIDGNMIYSPNIYGQNLRLDIGKDYTTYGDGAFEIISHRGSSTGTSIFKVENSASVIPHAQISSPNGFDIKSSNGECLFWCDVETLGALNVSDALILEEGVTYGTLAQRNAIVSPLEGQIFFVVT